ncbi:sarcosine oxidase [Pseudomaricurvus sp. HS19]|uniref:sarcosine oxidase n=1 Tax=Pseudomaricurvus sp. HS19 TaxID=2692626 RepID=UPI00136F6690|nr:sarcosine oxidase [Pseudomaricurvus sp. HS19]MYM64792.1 sarcosine oxidase [Pseudomaricurvus sp. HS19]
MSQLKIDTPSPVVFSKRSPIYRQQAGALFAERDGAAIALQVTDTESRAQLQQSALLDLSATFRSGVRGRTASQWLGQQQLPLPAQANQSVTTRDGELVLRLGNSELWILGNPLRDNSTLAKQLQSAPASAGCYPLSCQHSHSWFVLSGECRSAVMAKLCGVDMRESVFGPGALAMTSVARVSAIVVSHELQGVPVFSILSDCTSATYMWQALLDALQEFGGSDAGIASLLPAN